MSKEIHRKIVFEKIKAKWELHKKLTITKDQYGAPLISNEPAPPEVLMQPQDWDDIIRVVESYDSLLKRVGKNLHNSRKANKDSTKAIQKYITDKQYWVNRSQIAERRLEMTRNKMWEVENLFRNLGFKLRTESLMEMAAKHAEDEKRGKIFLDELDKTILNELKNKNNS